MSSDKITGWVAWHPIEGADKDTISWKSEDQAWYYKIYTPVLLLDADRSYEDAFAFNKQNAIANGWRIRPVEIVFTDEGEK